MIRFLRFVQFVAVALAFASAIYYPPRLIAAESPKGWVLLPLAGFGGDLGFGAGAQLAVSGIDDTNWGLSSYAFATATQRQFSGATFTNRHWLNDIFYASLSARYSDSRATKFFGLTNESSLENTQLLSLIQNAISARMGVHLYGEWVLGVGASLTQYMVGRSPDTSYPQYLDQPQLPSNPSGETALLHEVFLLYDDRLPENAPQAGVSGQISHLKSQPRTPDETQLERVSASVAPLLPIVDGTLILASRIRYDRVWGTNLPFYLRPRLGGSSALRSYRSGRFVDDGSLLANVETRLTVWNISGEWFSRAEVSLGYETGKVFRETLAPSLDGLHSGGLLGLTLVTATGFPIRFEAAQGAEGSQFYGEVFYPF